MLDKQQEFRKVFPILPAVLIQDLERDCAYHIPSDRLKAYRTTEDTWSKIDPSTVTFVIPDRELLDEVPPFLRTRGIKRPSVLVQYRRQREAFFLTFDELQKYKVEQPTEHPVGTISFILPFGMELVEELSVFCTRCLQSGTGAEFTDN